MPSNATGTRITALAARYPGRLGNLIGPGGWRSTILPDYALDNGAYPAFTKGTPWDEAAFLDLCRRAQEFSVFRTAPRWVVVPDVVGDWAATRVRWDDWAPRLRERYGWPLALAVQDGATVEDARALAPDVVFIGGSRAWKWRTALTWTLHFPRVHVGRVNNYVDLWSSELIGAESADGTGMSRTTRQRAQMDRYLAESAAWSTLRRVA